MITLKKNQRTIRETSAEFQFNDPDSGELRNETIRVLYYSPTTAQTKETQEEIRKRLDDKDDRVAWYYSDSLIRLLHSLPDLIDEETNAPHPISIEFLDSIDAINVERIMNAINKDIEAGKSQPAK